MNTTEKRISRLITVLDEVISLLEWDENKHWHKTMAQAKERLQNDDLSGIDILLRSYGGMSSFNDLLIGQITENGKFISWKDGYEEKQNALKSLREEAYLIAKEINRENKLK